MKVVYASCDRREACQMCGVLAYVLFERDAWTCLSTAVRVTAPIRVCASCGGQRQLFGRAE